VLKLILFFLKWGKVFIDRLGYYLMSLFNTEISVRSLKDRVTRWLTDPFLVSGIFGHVSLLQIYDANSKQYLTPSQISNPSNRFKVLYVFGTPNTKIHTMLGIMEGPKILPSGILYEGEDDEGKFKWKIEFRLKSEDKETRIGISVTADYRVSGLDRLLGRSPFALAEHIVKDHIVPYFKYYFKESIEANEIVPNLVYENNSNFAAILPELTTLIKNIEYGLLSISGDNINGDIIVKNGKFNFTKILYKGKVLEGDNILLELVSIPEKINVKLYSVNIDEVMYSLAQKVKIQNYS